MCRAVPRRYLRELEAEDVAVEQAVAVLEADIVAFASARDKVRTCRCPARRGAAAAV